MKKITDYHGRGQKTLQLRLPAIKQSSRSGLSQKCPSLDLLHSMPKSRYRSNRSRSRSTNTSKKLYNEKQFTQLHQLDLDLIKNRNTPSTKEHDFKIRSETLTFLKNASNSKRSRSNTTCDSFLQLPPIHPETINSGSIFMECEKALERTRQIFNIGNQSSIKEKNTNASTNDQRIEDKSIDQGTGRDISNNTDAAVPIFIVVDGSVKSEEDRYKITGSEEDDVDEELSDEEADESTEQEPTRPEYDYDGDFQETETYDLSTFDFEGLTKPNKPVLTVNQEEYQRYCHLFNVLPNAYIVRQLPTTSLLLRCQQLGTLRIKALCSALAFNASIQELEISEEFIDTQAMTYMVEAFHENNAIERLFLQDNRMGRQVVKLLMEYLNQSDRLASLNLAGNELEDTDGELFVLYLTNSVNLVNLDLSHNRFRDEAPEVLAKALVKNTTLLNLSLSWNHIREDGMRRFLSTLTKNHGVESLDISWNAMNLASIRTLASLLRRNDTLTTLDISACRINSQQLIELSDALTKTKCIRSIVLGTNVFSDNDIFLAVKQLAQAKGNMSLREIDLVEMVVTIRTYELCQELMQKKDILVYHGNVLGMDVRSMNDGDELASMNPVTVLIEFGRLMGMRIKELFDFMDKDGNKILTREEIKLGLQEFDIPLPDRSLDVLIRRMDMDGDGEISITELVASGQVNTRMRLKDQMMAKETKTSVKNTETARCRKILARMIHDHQKIKLEKVKKARKIERESKKKRVGIKKRPSISSSSSEGDMGLDERQGSIGERSSVDFDRKASSLSRASYSVEEEAEDDLDENKGLLRFSFIENK